LKVRSVLYSLPWNRVAQTHIEAISAIERYTKEKPTNTIRNAQITPAVPPLVMIVVRVVSSTSHVAIRVHANPTIDVNWKFLWSVMSEDGECVNIHAQSI
jgi:ribosomal protein S7